MSEAYAEDLTDEGMDPEAEAAPAQSGVERLLANIKNPNIADGLDASELARIGSKVVEEFGIDESSLTEWRTRYDAAMKLAMQVKEAKNTPWPNAANVKHPLISTAAIQFNARAYPALIDGPNVVKGATKGRPSEEKTARAERIGSHMSWQLLEQMDDWEEDTDLLLIQLPVVGCAFRKTWFDPLKGYNCSHLVAAGSFVVNYMTKDLETCPRATHVLTFYPHEIAEKMRSGVWLTAELGQAANAQNDDQAPHEFLEQHRLWDLDEDGYAEPYIVTVHKETQKVLRIVARYDEKGVQHDGKQVIRITAKRSFTKYTFMPAIDGSFYGMGFGTLLLPISGTIDTVLNQLLDAGTLSNMQGGFIGQGVSIKSGVSGFRPGEWKKVESTGASLKDNIVPLPVKEPSSVLFSILGMMIEAAKDLTATQDILGGDAGKGALPVGTVTALIEQGLKTFTAIVKRLHRALKKELAVLYDLNARYLNPEEYFTFQDQEGVVAQQDYAEGDIDVVPLSDPNMATDMQRMQQAQFVMEVATTTQQVPMRSAAKMALEAAKVPEVERLLTPEGPPPPDPKVIEAHAKALLDERRVDIEEATAKADIAVKEATAQKAAIEAIMMAPDFQMQVAAFIDQRVAEQLGQTNGGQPQVQQPDVPGMGQPPPDQGLPPLPGGPAPADDGGLGQGGPDVAGPPDQGPPPPGAFNPGMG